MVSPHITKPAGALAALLIVCAGVWAGAATGGDNHKVTICHAAGQAGTTKYETIEVDEHALKGHFDENGTPQAGHEQDYMGACESDTTTDTTPTDTTPTTPTVTQPPHVVTGAASVICDNHTYKVTGTVDGQAADTVNPATLPGTTKGTVEVTVTRGDTSVRTTVTVNGDCAAVPPAVTQPPAATTPPVTTNAPSVTPPTKPPAVKPKPPVKPKPKVAPKPKPKPKLTGNPKTDKCKPMKGGTLNCQGTVVVPGSG